MMNNKIRLILYSLNFKMCTMILCLMMALFCTSFLMGCKNQASYEAGTEKQLDYESRKDDETFADYLKVCQREYNEGLQQIQEIDFEHPDKAKTRGLSSKFALATYVNFMNKSFFDKTAKYEQVVAACPNANELYSFSVCLEKIAEAGSVEEALLRYDIIYKQAIIIPEHYDGILKDKIIMLRNHIIEVYENDTKPNLQGQELERKVKAEKATNYRYENDYENEDDKENCDDSYIADSYSYERVKNSKKISDQKSEKFENENKLLKYYIIYKMMHP